MALFQLNLPVLNIQACYTKHVLEFKKPAGTSRGIMTSKDSYILKVCHSNNPEIYGVGECSPIWGLSPDNEEHYEETIKSLCQDIHNYPSWLSNKLTDYPSIAFGLEMALKDLEQGGTKELFPSNYTKGSDSVEINGLVWMGDISFMQQQIAAKIADGYDCIKLKIGSLNFEDEISLLQQIRDTYPADKLSIRLDANGAFAPEDALTKLERLSKFHIHSLEQPIKAGNWSEMKRICANSPIPIALDEELIGVYSLDEKTKLLQSIQPQFLILKPSLLGGFKATESWINLAVSLNIKWWITSALESNIGLNAIAQFTYITNNKMPQGLGTGSLYKNNIGEVDFLKSKHFFHQSFALPSSITNSK